MTTASRTFKGRLSGPEPLHGLVVKAPCAALIETAGHAGLDYVIIDAEHGAGESLELEHHVRAADSAGIAALVRVAANRPEEILHALDAGAAGIVVPHVEDARSAREAVASAHYPPVGRRGLATSTRAGRHGLRALGDHLEAARAGTVVIVQIEDAAAVPRAAEIADVEHVDAVFLGPTDLSMSLGHPGELDHPDVAAAISDVVAGVAGSHCALAVLASAEEQALAWRERGAQMISFAAPNLIAARLRELSDGLRRERALTTEGAP